MSESRYQMEARALRTAIGIAIGCLLEASQRSRDRFTANDIVATIAYLEKVTAVDFTDPDQRAKYRPRGGC